MEYGLFSKDAALKIEVQPGTMRQWCLAIEKEGYKFERNEKDQRIFYERDINMLFEIKTKLKKTRDRNNTIKTVVERYLFEMNTDISPSVHEEKREIIELSKEDLQTMLNNAVEKGTNNAMDQQQKFNKELLDRLDKQNEYIQKQQQYIDDRINQRDKDLLEGIRELQEQKQLAAAKEEEEQNKNPWWKFWE